MAKVSTVKDSVALILKKNPLELMKKIANNFYYLIA